MAEQEVTAVLSNMSVVKMPEDYAQYIEKFGVYTSTNRTELCICSFQDTLSLGFTSRYDSTNIQRNFYRILKELGASVKVAEPDFPEDARPNYEGKKVLQIFTFCCIAAIVISMMTDNIRGSRVSDDVAYDGSRLCETVQSAEECGMAASNHVRDLCIVGSRNRMERLVCEYRNSGYLPADPGCNVDHIKNTFPVTERIYDLLCDGRCLFDDSSIDSFSDRSNPLQDSIGYLYRVQFSAVDRINFIQTKRI